LPGAAMLAALIREVSVFMPEHASPRAVWRAQASRLRIGYTPPTLWNRLAA
jgi:hypothetical protein